jgi:hypothetical protein
VRSTLKRGEDEDLANALPRAALEEKRASLRRDYISTRAWKSERIYNGLQAQGALGVRDATANVIVFDCQHAGAACAADFG